MKPFDQLHLHAPPESIGDCERTCIACLLEVPVVDVPHLAEMIFRDGLSQAEAHTVIAQWLASKGYGYLRVIYGAANEFAYWPAGLCIAGGKSPRGYINGHAVVWSMDSSGGTLAHDPHPSRAGLDGPPEDLIYLVPLDPAVQQ